MTQNELFSDLLCTDQMHLAERELSAFVGAVAELFGADEARMSAEDWFDELEFMDLLPGSSWRDWRAITIAASVRLANRLNIALHRQHSDSRKASGSRVSPMASSNCFDSILVS